MNQCKERRGRVVLVNEDETICTCIYRFHQMGIVGAVVMIKQLTSKRYCFIHVHALSIYLFF